MMGSNNIHLDGFSEWLQNSIDQSTKRINKLNFKGILEHNVYDLDVIASSATKQNNNIQTAFSRMLETKKADYPELANQFDEIYNQYMEKWNNFYNNTIPMDAIKQQIRGLENAKKYNYGRRRDDVLRKMNDNINREVSDLNNIVDRKLYEAGYSSQYGYNQANKAYTSRYHSNIDGYIHYGGFGNQNFRKDFFNDEAIARYEQIKKQYPDLTLDNRTINYEFDIDKAYEQALDMNERYIYEQERKDKTIQRHKDRRQNRKENRQWAKETFYDGKKEYATKEVQRRSEMLENAQNEISKLQKQLQAINPNASDPVSINKRSSLEGEIKYRQERLAFHQEKLANARADLEKIAPTPKRKRRAARRDPNNENILESMVTQLETRKHYDQTPWRKKEEAQRRVEQAEQRQAQQQRVKDIRNEQAKINNTNTDINDELEPHEWDTKYLDVAEFPNGPQDVIDMAHEEALKMNATFGDTVKETIENTTENVLEETAEAVGETVAEEVGEKIIKKVTGINTELDGLNKKRRPKKLKKGTGKYKAKTLTANNEIYDRFANSRYWAVDLPESNGDFAVHGPNGTKRLEKEKIDQQRRKRKYEQTRQNQSQDTSTLKNTNNTSEPINADEPVNPINPNDGNENSANMNGSSGGDGSGGNGGDGGNTANPSDDGGSGKKRRKGNSSQADLPKISKLDVDLPEVTREGGSISKYLKEFSNMGFFDKVQTIGAAAGAVSEYKNARRQGHGVISSVARAGVDFALGEAMGLYYPLFLGAKALPGAIVKGSEMLYKENRKMNSMANQQIFGGVQFQDTQQLATMRQSGMEMAKMAQYNLQQTLMGNEATYFHR